MLCYRFVITIFAICSFSSNAGVVLSTTVENSATNTNSLDDNNNKNPLPNIFLLRQYPPYQQFGGGSMIGGEPMFGGRPMYGGGPMFGGGGGSGGGCPLCDSSVYGYCSHKALHDMCCCDYQGSYYRPQQCSYVDCSLLYAKTCYESSLIRNCCCNSPY